MRAPATITRAALTIAATIALAGCAAAASNTTPTAKLPPIYFASTAIPAHIIPARYTCDGQNISPPLQWGKVPANTGELLAAAVGFQPTTRTGRYNITVEWALGGINPHLHRLDPGQQPRGTYLGLTTNNKRNYDICPPKHTSRHYQFMLYALPNTLRLSHAFDALEIIAAISKPNTETSATAQGAFPADYARK